jgi:hypothetical protein
MQEFRKDMSIGDDPEVLSHFKVPTLEEILDTCLTKKEKWISYSDTFKGFDPICPVTIDGTMTGITILLSKGTNIPYEVKDGDKVIGTVHVVNLLRIVLCKITDGSKFKMLVHDAPYNPSVWDFGDLNTVLFENARRILEAQDIPWDDLGIADKEDDTVATKTVNNNKEVDVVTTKTEAKNIGKSTLEALEKMKASVVAETTTQITAKTINQMANRPKKSAPEALGINLEEAKDHFCQISFSMKPGRWYMKHTQNARQYVGKDTFRIVDLSTVTSEANNEALGFVPVTYGDVLVDGMTWHLNHDNHYIPWVGDAGYCLYICRHIPGQDSPFIHGVTAKHLYNDPNGKEFEAMVSGLKMKQDVIVEENGEKKVAQKWVYKPEFSIQQVAQILSFAHVKLQELQDDFGANIFAKIE